MKFNLKNHEVFAKYEIEKPEARNTTRITASNIFDKKLSLPEIITNLNSSQLLNIESKEEVSIIFEDFTWFGKVKNKLQNFIHKKLDKEILENSMAHYDNTTQSIHIFNGIIEPKTNNIEFKESYNKLINSVSNSNFIVNFFVLHEIGHAIYDNMNKKDYGNFTDYFKEENSNLIHKQQNTILHENFADMFAAIAYLTIEQNNPNLIKDLELFSQFRKEIKQEKYYTFNNLDKVINDYKTNNLNFSTNEKLLEYINIQTNNE